MSEISYTEYWAEVASIAAEVAREARENDSDRSDVLHQTIDGHQWVIYTAYNPHVLLHSKNEDAYFDEYGDLTVSSYSDAMSKMAFAALNADVRDALADISEDEESDTEESDTEESDTEDKVSKSV